MGVYIFRMDEKQRERLPMVFTEVGLPTPSLKHEAGVVRYCFKLGLLRRLKVDVFEIERPSGKTYDLWIPLTRAGEELFLALQARGYSRVPPESRNDTKSAD